MAMPADTDDDGDGEPDISDNCPRTLGGNADQTDTDGDGLGDVCDDDDDNDGDLDGADNCPLVYNPDQLDVDLDGTPGVGGGDACDALVDRDGDGVADDVDNCLTIPNNSQTDANNNGVGDACDAYVDADLDGVPDDINANGSYDIGDDNCPAVANSKQQNNDYADELANSLPVQGDACDDDDDNDGILDAAPDNCLLIANPISRMLTATISVMRATASGQRQRRSGEQCGQLSEHARRRWFPDAGDDDQTDSDGDGIGDLCDDATIVDTDGDGHADTADNCPAIANSNQKNSDGDVYNASDSSTGGDVCDVMMTTTVSWTRHRTTVC